LYADLYNKLKDGELNIFQHSSHKSSQDQPFDLKNNISFYVHSYMYAYLKYLQEFNQKSNVVNHDPVLFRNPQTGEVDPFENLDEGETLRFVLGGLLFDPMGGLFTANKFLKREHLRVRATLMRSLWDMSLKLKMNLLKDQ